MLERILRHLRNWFVVAGGVHHGTFTVENGSITLPFLQNGQYFRVIGSVFNDGVYQYGNDATLQAETFTGTIWALAIPKAVLTLCEEITAWEEKYGEAATGPYQSESFGGYSYAKASSEDGGAVTWEKAFQKRLNQWRKI